MSDLEQRMRVLRSYGAAGGTVEELLRYNTNRFSQPAVLTPQTYPLPDEEFVATWIDYARNAESGKVFEFLRTRLVQLAFPIREGISRSDDYIAVTRRGQAVEEVQTATGLVLEQRVDLSVSIYQTPAGKIPILYAPHRPDFVSLVRALTMRNEPLSIPESMGACMVSGYNNWDRIGAYQKSCGNDSDWGTEFLRLIPRKELYQDRFLLLSGGYYSGIAPEALELSDTVWREKSLTIRREHECTHYFTRRVFSSMRNHVLDELIADYAGIVSATGSFRADWLLRFMGLEDYPTYRSGGRFENYQGEPPLSDTALGILRALVKSAVEALQSFTARHAGLLSRPDFRQLVITALSTLTLEELADTDCQERLTKALKCAVERTVISIEGS